MTRRRYQVHDAPGMYVYRLDYGEEPWEVEGHYSEVSDPALLEAAVCHAAEGYGPWRTKREAMECARESYILHAEAEERQK